MKEKMRKFMLGRYGFDELSKVCLGTTVVLMVCSMFLGNRLLYLMAIGLLICCYYRAFSRNIEKRRAEGQKYRNFRYQNTVRWNAFKKRQEQKKLYCFYKCPQCRQKVRVPKGRGRICITCPKCSREFIKKS